MFGLNQNERGTFNPEKEFMKTNLNLTVALVLTLAADSGVAATRYVDVNSSSPTWPYSNWVTAAATIQQAVDAAVLPRECASIEVRTAKCRANK